MEKEKRRKLGTKFRSLCFLYLPYRQQPVLLHGMWVSAKTVDSAQGRGLCWLLGCMAV